MVIPVPTGQPPSWPGLLNRLIERADLTEADTTWAMGQIMSGSATPAQIAGFAVALRAKGETPQEIAGMAAGMLAHARLVHVDGHAVDVVGTGGDQAHTVNISTMAAITAAAAGVPVVKHGNRAASSQCGTADVLEELGVAIELSPDAVATCVREVGIGFCFAAVFHPAFRVTGPPRRELGIPTVFNVLGPLTNPAKPTAGLVGCANLRMAPLVAEVFAGRGASVLVVRGEDNLDEITTTTTTRAWVVSGGVVREERIDPARLGVSPATPADLRGGDAAFNAAVVRDLVAGKPGPVRDAVLLNAAGAIAAFRGFTGDLHADLEAGLGQAAHALDSGAGATLLDRWTATSRRLAAKEA
ncbi:Anthranilate phosphoribosyltransferase [Actinokineospora spheciospongiae]|uniref:Anthranilate phosphoribosyltransferase n=1 Tax=Actinokineospora spheciospongiae TaxID=909613 RepID=W7IX49_9PSEU|nr:anthranilate phosphoribosyltransferase [Actinokineospora spheciospongiae]EWC61407.1 Anthranilate phosphoribosyltransferase [Actinokineospora spheciospongiae]PWW58332.1 anthranilate phosphoribosyltransferase [Actinokineospora spheciospongiae]